MPQAFVVTDLLWNPVTIEPPHDTDIEFLCLGDEKLILTGFAHRRLLGGKLTFWSWIDGRCRNVRPFAWRLKA